jgi:hypothetical protein
VLATLLIHRIWNEFRVVISVLQANSRVREPAGDRIRKNSAQKITQKVDIFGPSTNHKQAINYELVAVDFNLPYYVSTN